MMKRAKSRVVTAMIAAGAAVMALPLVANAGPPVMAPIPEVVDYASVGTEVSAAGASVVTIIGGIILAFGLIWMVIHKAKGAIRG